MNLKHLAQSTRAAAVRGLPLNPVDVIALCDFVIAKRTWPKRDRKDYIRDYQRKRRAKLKDSQNENAPNISN